MTNKNKNDPLKLFRNATTHFLIGLTSVDLFTALVQEPIYATCFMLLYFQHPSTKKWVPFMNAGRYFGAFTMTASFLIVFFFTVTQYIVVSSPLKYGRLVTKRNVLICVSVIYLHTATFWCLHLMGVSPNVQDIMDLFIHSYLLAIITIVFYILLHLAMRKKMAAGKSLEGQPGNRESGKHIQVQRNFCSCEFHASIRVDCMQHACGCHRDDKTFHGRQQNPSLHEDHDWKPNG